MKNESRIEQISQEKIKRNPDLNKDMSDIKNSFNRWTKNKNEYEEIKKYLDSRIEEIGSSKCTIQVVISSFLRDKKKRAFIKGAAFSNFAKKAFVFQKKHDDSCVVLCYENEKITCEVSLLSSFILCQLDIIKDKSKFIHKEVLKSGKIDKGIHDAFAIDWKDGIYIPGVIIKDSSNSDNLLRQLSNKLSLYFPTIMTYESPGVQKAFLVSIPQGSDFKEVVDTFSKKITRIHKYFFAKKKERPRTKEYYQSVFDQHFPILREKKYTIEKACREIATLFKEEHDHDISWQTVWRNYYQAWKKTKKGIGKKKKVGIKR